MGGAAAPPTLLETWQALRDSWCDVIAEIGEWLGPHLRHPGWIGPRAPFSADELSCAVAIGDSTIEFECDPEPFVASPAEPEILSAFGPHARLIRISAWRSVGSRRELESAVVAEPASRHWVASPPGLGPASLLDRRATEAFVWHLIAN